MRGGAGVHDGAAIVEHFDLGVLAEGCDATGDLHVGADANSQLLDVASSAAAGLLGAQLGVASRSERLVERGLIVANVVGLADDGGVRFQELRDQVDAANLGGIHPQFEGEQVHRSLGGGGGLRTTCAAVGGGDRSVGDHAGGAHLDIGNVVYRAGHRPRHERREDGAHLDEVAGVLDGVQLIVGDLAGASAADGDVLHLCAAVAEHHHRFAACLAPAQRPTDLRGQHAEDGLFRITRNLGAEPATNIGRDDLDLCGLDTIDLGDGGKCSLSALGAEPLVQTPVDPGNCRPANFEWAWCDALIEEATFDNDFAAFEECVAGVLGHTQHRRVEHDVAARLLVEQRRAGECGFDVDDRGQRVVVDDDLLGGVLALLPLLGDDDGNGLADEADFADGQHAAGDGWVEVAGDRLEP